MRVCLLKMMSIIFHNYKRKNEENDEIQLKIKFHFKYYDSM